MLSNPRTEFIHKHAEIVFIYERAFAGKPYFVTYQKGDAEKIILAHRKKPGFISFLEYASTHVTGALWADTPSLQELRIEWGEQLADFAYQTATGKGVEIAQRGSVFWEREIFVDPRYHKKGIGTRLRDRFNQYLEKESQQNILLLLRMRDDNDAIISMAQKIGYQRIGIKTPSRKAGITNDYWFKLFLKDSK